MKWLEIAVPVRHEDIDAVSAVFDGLGSGGVVIEDPALIYDVVSRGNSETVAMEGPPDPDAPPVVKGYLPSDERLAVKLDSLYAGLAAVDPAYPGKVSLGEADDSGWLDRWREFYRPVRVGRRLLVRPSWEPAGDEGDLLVIEMDPGMAFGCGTHPTTTMCMAMIEEAVRGGETVLDVGTGSGILSVAAARLGAASVLAVDSDLTAVRVAGENAAANGLSGRITVREGNLLDGIDTPADIIVANIIADVIIRLVPQAVSLLADGGIFITSGIIAGRRDEVASALAGQGLEVLKTATEGEWVAFMAKKVTI